MGNIDSWWGLPEEDRAAPNGKEYQISKGLALVLGGVPFQVALTVTTHWSFGDWQWWLVTGTAFLWASLTGFGE